MGASKPVCQSISPTHRKSGILRHCLPPGGLSRGRQCQGVKVSRAKLVTCCRRVRHLVMYDVIQSAKFSIVCSSVFSLLILL